jgi:hypothetical protein
LGWLNPIIGHDAGLRGDRADYYTGSNPFSYIQRMPPSLVVGTHASYWFHFCIRLCLPWNPFTTRVFRS